MKTLTITTGLLLSLLVPGDASAQSRALQEAHAAAGRAWTSARSVQNRAASAQNQLGFVWNRLWHSKIKKGGAARAQGLAEFRSALSGAAAGYDAAVGAFFASKSAYATLLRLQRANLKPGGRYLIRSTQNQMNVCDRTIAALRRSRQRMIDSWNARIARIR